MTKESVPALSIMLKLWGSQNVLGTASKISYQAQRSSIVDVILVREAFP